MSLHTLLQNSLQCFINIPSTCGNVSVCDRPYGFKAQSILIHLKPVVDTSLVALSPTYFEGSLLPMTLLLAVVVTVACHHGPCLDLNRKSNCQDIDLFIYMPRVENVTSRPFCWHRCYDPMTETFQIFFIYFRLSLGTFQCGMYDCNITI